ncbi:M16 family metallopeptidase [Flavivirga spongiicola]|uniref:Insulinase family protein n=1 Tax=Flavivirga spongiicola TaxID=421621 RepID=A0ABU7Y0I6_9FLAO|nr:M16 family metallopeptidase [Flavivirga sp. MEBiC05379]MDO5980746.1 insulinase family protein [Flavivirga sp. MEBiC05379]
MIKQQVKTIAFLLFIVSTITNLLAQEVVKSVDSNSLLPIDQSIKKGVLPNGLTYYLKSTDITKDVASYYIIQNVGSVLENDDQQGLAHFLEHMAFNGTKNFEGKGILNTMQKHGLVFGKDINAYTSFDETVYNINNIPTTPELIDTGLLVLHDWSNYLLLTDEEIDAERGVIKEEWRTRQNGGMRILQKNIGTMFNDSKYAQRMPIGLMDIVDNFEYKALRDFYHDWYRTDLQAIAIIGDIDVNQVEKKIKALFSKIPAVNNPKERFVVNIPDNDVMLYSMAMDEEVSTSSISFGIRHPKPLKEETVASLKESLLNNMITSMLSARINELSRKPEATFLGAGIGYSDHSRSTKAFNISVSPKPNQQHAAFKSVLTEVNRAVKFGFSKAEIERIITNFTSYYENQISKKDDMSHSRIVQLIQDNYLTNVAITDIEKEFEIVKRIFSTLKSDEINVALKKLYADKNRFLTVTGVKGNNNLTKEDALNIISKVENDASIEAYTDEFGGKTLISGITIKKGAITSEEENKILGSTTFTLDNGIKVHYKYANKNANDVKLMGLSKGGTSLLKDTDLPSANLLGNVIQYSGLGDYSATDLPKVLAGKTASASVSVSNLSESVSGSSVTKDTETMLQMVYLRFVKPRFDENGFNVIMQNVENYKIRRKENVAEKMKDSMTVTLYGNNNPKRRLFNDDFIKDISFDKIKVIYNDRFSNAADFEFFIVGDIQKDALKPLLEKYIASIPTNDIKENWKNNSTPWLSGKIDKDIYLKMEDPKSSVRISYKNDYEYSLKNALIARTLGDMLDLRYTETLREEEGGTYGASTSAGLSKRPLQKASISVNFDCNPEKVETLIAIVHEEINKIAQGNIIQVDLDKTLTNYLKERKQQKDYNSYDMSLLTRFYREGYNMNDSKNFEDIINSITTKDIQNFVKTFLKDAKSYEIVFKPKV